MLKRRYKFKLKGQWCWVYNLIISALTCCRVFKFSCYEKNKCLNKSTEKSRYCNILPQ